VWVFDENDCTLYRLPPNTTAMTQPLDVQFMSVLKVCSKHYSYFLVVLESGINRCYSVSGRLLAAGLVLLAVLSTTGRSWEARPSCRHDEFLCASGDRCLARSWVCDRVLDCGDGSDERHSPVSACTISSACIDIVHDRHCWQLRADSC